MTDAAAVQQNTVVCCHSCSCDIAAQLKFMQQRFKNNSLTFTAISVQYYTQLPLSIQRLRRSTLRDKQ